MSWGAHARRNLQGFSWIWLNFCKCFLFLIQAFLLNWHEPIHSFSLDFSEVESGLVSYQNFRSISTVEGYGIDQKVESFRREWTRVWDGFIMNVGNIHLHRCHPVSGQSACFIRADSSGITHGLAGIQMAYQVIILHHFLETCNGT